MKVYLFTECTYALKINGIRYCIISKYVCTRVGGYIGYGLFAPGNRAYSFRKRGRQNSLDPGTFAPYNTVLYNPGISTVLPEVCSVVKQLISNLRAHRSTVNVIFRPHGRTFSATTGYFPSEPPYKVTWWL